MNRIIPAGLISVGFQKITTNSTATALNSTCSVGSSFLISTETQSARIRFDAGTPAASTGVLLTAAAGPYFFDGVNGANIRIARAAAGAVVQVQAWKRPGQ